MKEVTITVKIVKAVVVMTPCTDTAFDAVRLDLDCPPRFTATSLPPRLSVTMKYGTGAAWVRETFGIEPEVIRV